MLDIMIVVLNLMAFGFLIIGIEHEGEQPYWNIIMTFISGILFLVLAGMTSVIETPYEIFNATSGNIETGFHKYYTGDLILFYYFCFIPTSMYFIDLILHKQLVRLFKYFKG